MVASGLDRAASTSSSFATCMPFALTEKPPGAEIAASSLRSSPVRGARKTRAIARATRGQARALIRLLTSVRVTPDMGEVFHSRAPPTRVFRSRGRAGSRSAAAVVIE